MKRVEKKLRRAQPRKKTPPISLRGYSGDRFTLLVDEELVTTELVQTSGRQPLFLKLGEGLQLTLESRRLNKRRYPQLRVEVAGCRTRPAVVHDRAFFATVRAEKGGAK